MHRVIVTGARREEVSFYPVQPGICVVGGRRVPRPLALDIGREPNSPYSPAVPERRTIDHPAAGAGEPCHYVDVQIRILAIAITLEDDLRDSPNSGRHDSPLRAATAFFRAGSFSIASWPTMACFVAQISDQGNRISICALIMAIQRSSGLRGVDG